MKEHIINKPYLLPMNNFVNDENQEQRYEPNNKSQHR